MATKSITIDLEAYERLKGRKNGSESFSEAIKRLVPKAVDLTALFDRMTSNPLSPAAVAAIEEQIGQRGSAKNRKRKR